MYSPDDNFDNAFQRQFKRSIGVPGEPAGGPVSDPGFQGGPRGGGVPMEPKRVTQDNGPNPLRRGWNGWQEQEPAPFEGGPFGGAGGPMPIPDGGPIRHDMTGGFDPVGPMGGMGGPVDVPNGSGAGGPMPIPWPAGASPVPGNPNAYYMQNHPNNPNSKYAQWKASQQQAPAPGNTGIVPPRVGDGMNGGRRILGGPYGPPHPQGGTQVPQFNFAQSLPQPAQQSWDWNNMANITNRRY